VKTKTKAKSTI